MNPRRAWTRARGVLLLPLRAPHSALRRATHSVPQTTFTPLPPQTLNREVRSSSIRVGVRFTIVPLKRSSEYVGRGRCFCTNAGERGGRHGGESAPGAVANSPTEADAAWVAFALASEPGGNRTLARAWRGLALFPQKSAVPSICVPLSAHLPNPPAPHTKPVQASHRACNGGGVGETRWCNVRPLTEMHALRCRGVLSGRFRTICVLVSSRHEWIMESPPGGSAAPSWVGRCGSPCDTAIRAARPLIASDP
eukprot:gene22021-biopygen19211